MTKKLKILGPYTPEHEGPFCTRDGRSVRIICTDCAGQWPIVGLVTESASESPRGFCKDGRYLPNEVISDGDIMNAREVPVAREFWVNEYAGKDGLFHNIFENEATANRHKADTFLRTIHVREVLPGDGE